MTRVVVATHNAHKLAEYRELLPAAQICALADFPPMAEPVEDAPDFAGNAIIKARATFAHTGVPSMADDSGICVDALGGAPGVISARYAPGSDDDRLRALLAAMHGFTERAAQFVCVIAVAGLPANLRLPDGLTRRDGCVLARGEVHGVLTRAPRGANGFGYDPIFELPHGRTTAEISATEKHAISHRGRAARSIARLLDLLVDASEVSG